MTDTQINIRINGGGKVETDLRKIGRAGDDALGRQIPVATGKASASLKAFGAVTNDVKVRLSGLAGNLGSVGVGLSKLGGIGLTLAAGLGAGALAARSSVNTFAEFEKRLVAVGKTTNASGEELKALGAGVQDLSHTLPIATNELLDITTAAGQLGVQGNENLIKFTKTLGQLQLSTNIIGQDGASNVARLLTVTGDGIDKVDRFGSSIVELGNNFAATESEILQTATRVGQGTAQFQIGSANVLGIATALTALGAEAEASGTVIGQTFAKIDTAVRKGGDDLQAFATIAGTSAEEFGRVYQDDATSGFEKFIEGLGRIRDAGGSVKLALENVGITGVRETAILSTLATRTDVLSDAIDKANTGWEQNTALTKEALTAATTFSSQMQLVKNDIDQSAVALGKFLAPEIIAGAHALGDSFLYVQEHAGGLKLIAEGLVVVVGGKVVASIAAMTASAVASASGISALDVALLGATVQMRAAAVAGAALRSVLTFLGGPVGAAVSALGIAYLVLSENTDKAKQSSDEYAEAVRHVNLVNDEATKGAQGLARERLEQDRATIAATVSTLELALAEEKLNLERSKNKPEVSPGQFGLNRKEAGDIIGGRIDALNDQLSVARENLKAADEALTNFKKNISTPPPVTSTGDSNLLSDADKASLKKYESERKQALAEIARLEETATKAGLEGVALLEQKRDEELTTQKDRLANKIINEEEYARARLAIEDTFQKEKADIEKKAAEKAADEAKRTQEKLDDERKRAAEKIAQETAAPFVHAAENIQDSFTTLFKDILDGGVNSFKDFGNSVLNVFKQMLAEMATLAIARPIIVPIVTSIAGSLGSSQAGAQVAQSLGGGSGGSGGLGGLGSLGSLAGGSSLFSNTGTIGRFLSNSGRGFGSTFGDLGASNLAGNFLAGFAGNQFGSFLADKWGGGQSGGNVGGAIGGILGSFFGPIGSFLGAAGGNFLGSFFGAQPSDQTQSSYVNLATGSYDLRGATGSKFSQQNQDAAEAFGQQAAQFANLLATTFGSEFSDTLRVIVGSRDGLRLQVGSGAISNYGTDPEAFVKGIFDTLVNVASNIPAEAQAAFSKVDFSNLDQAAQDLQFIAGFTSGDLFDPPKLTAAEQALNALNAQFDAMAETADRLGLSVSKVELERLAAQSDLRTGFQQGIIDQIAAIQNPISLAIQQQTAANQDLLDQARALGIDTTDVLQLNALKLQQILDQSFSGIEQFLSGLSFTDTSPLTPAERLAAAQSQFDSQLSLARAGDAQAIQALPQVAQQLLAQGSAFYAGTQGFQDIFDTVQSTLRDFIDSGASGFDPVRVAVDQVGSQSVENTADIVQQIQALSANVSSNNAVLQATLDEFRQIVASLPAA